MSRDQSGNNATLYRMVMPGHLCRYGLKSRELLERHGFTVDDHWLETREQTDAFMAEHNVDTTPQVWIGDDHIGGHEALRAYFGDDPKAAGETSYQPVIAIFAVALLMALAVSWSAFGTVLTVRALQWFIAISMCFLAVQKLADVESFSTMFLNYDLLARRWLRYG